MVTEHEVLEAEIVHEDEPRPLPVRREAVGGLLRPVAKPAEVLLAQEETRALIQQTLTPGRDFDTIQGTNRPTLLKPGAERINAAFGCASRYRIIEKEIDHDRAVQWTKKKWEWGERKGEKIWSVESGESRGLYRYVMICELVHRESGVVIGEGVGSCSTMESKYVDRPRDVENTILKMAKKRAYVDATLSTFGLSEQFTQDVEDMEHVGGNGGSSSGHTHANGNGNGAESDMIECPKCGGAMYDNRKSKKGRQPDLKCKNKTGCEIKRLLEEKGLTQADVAARIGVTPQAVHEVVMGRTTSATARFAFAMAIGEDPESIWPRVHEGAPAPAPAA